MKRGLGILDVMAEGVIVIREGRIATWNLAASSLYGWQPHEAIGLSLSDLFELYPTEVVSSLGAQGSWEGHLVRPRFNGESITVRARCFRGDSLGMAPDEIVEISSRLDAGHPAERRLAASEYRYRNLFGAVAAAFWEIDFSGVGALLGELDDRAREDIERYLSENPAFVRGLMRATRNVDVNDRAVELFGPGDRRTLLAHSADTYWPEESTSDYAAAGRCCTNRHAG